jgi:thermolysin
MRKPTFLALAIVAAGCGGAGESAQQQRTTMEEANALEALQASTGRGWSFVRHDANRMHLEADRVGAPQLAKGGDVVATTHAFLAQYKSLFAMSDPASELVLRRAQTDELSMTHARFQQHVHGVPVFGAEVTAHYDAAGRITSIDSSYVPNLLGLDLQPAFDAEEARAIAKRDVLSLKKDALEADVVPGQGALVVHAVDVAKPALAYRVETRAIFGADPAIWITTIDAKTGAILDRYNNLQTIGGSGIGVLGDTKTLQVTQANGSYVLEDATHGATITTYSAGSQQITSEQGATQVTSNSATSWDTANPGPGAAVDAHYTAGVVYDYYKNVHGRNGIDGQNGAIMSAAHFGSQYDNAFWDGASMSYGDGGQLFRPLSAGLDVGSHEFTHGVTQATSNLTYQGQTGALNEAMSDIFGALIEHSVKPDPKNNWIMGENISLSGTTGIRDFINPANGQQPDNMSKYVNTQQDNGGVHINSGVVNNAMYLMTMGGKNPTSGNGPQYGIGWDTAAKVWYRVNSQYLQSTAKFADAASATMQAASDLKLTANESNIIDCAWKAVGVVQGACSTVTNPQSTTPGTNGGTTGGTSGGDRTGGSPGTSDSSGSGADSSGDNNGDGQTTTPTKHRTLATASSGCNVGTSSGADLSAIAGVLAVIGALGRRRRR